MYKLTVAFFIFTNFATAQVVTTSSMLEQLADPMGQLPQFRNYKVFQKTSAVDYANPHFCGNPNQTMHPNCDRWEQLQNKKDVVLADLEGPGAVVRIWSANPDRARNVRIYLDGSREPVVDAKLQDMLFGKVFPFEPPLAQASSGGGVSYFPIVFREHCRIVVDNPTDFYFQVTYLKYNPGVQVKSYIKPPRWGSRETASLAKIKKRWNEPERSVVLTHRERFVIPEGRRPYSVYSFAAPTGGIINALGFSRPEWSEGAPLDVKPDPRKIIVRITFDSHRLPDIEAPLADLLGNSFYFGLAPRGLERSLFVGKRLSDRGGWVDSFQLPMPFKNFAEVSFENGNEYPVSFDFYANHTDGVRFDENTTGYLHANFKQEYVTVGTPHTWLKSENDKGHFVGVVQSMLGTPFERIPGWVNLNEYLPLGFLEGDEQFLVDGQTFDETPRDKNFQTVFAREFNGTGTEDYFNSAYYFATGEGSYPLHGVTLKWESAGRRAAVGAFRFHLLDAPTFESRIEAQMEHGGANDALDGTYYSSTVFWYSRGESVRRDRPTPYAEEIPSLTVREKAVRR
jgi:hypothetical protein